MTMGPLPMSRTDLMELSLGIPEGYPGREGTPGGRGGPGNVNNRWGSWRSLATHATVSPSNRFCPQLVALRRAQRDNTVKCHGEPVEPLHSSLALIWCKRRECASLVCQRMRTELRLVTGYQCFLLGAAPPLDLLLASDRLVDVVEPFDQCQFDGPAIICEASWDQPLLMFSEPAFHIICNTDVVLAISATENIDEVVVAHRW